MAATLYPIAYNDVGVATIDAAGGARKQLFSWRKWHPFWTGAVPA
jgi:hypothetical protein